VSPPIKENEKEERRRVSRSRALGEVEMVETASGNVTRGRLIELSLIGCRVYVGHRLPVRGALKLRIMREGQTFEAIGIVVWSESQGTGIIFERFEEEQEQVLEKWIAALTGSSGDM